MFGRKFKEVARYKYPANMFGNSPDVIMARAIQTVKQLQVATEKTPHKYTAYLKDDGRTVVVVKSVAR